MHSNLQANHQKLAQRTDQPIATLLKDLKARGLLDSTLVVWAGEFGRTPTMEGNRTGETTRLRPIQSGWRAVG